MVRQITEKPTPGWKAILAIAVAAGGLLWHILACTESPMAFSPEGDLAFVTMEPYDTEHSDLEISGTHAYRLMIISKGKDLRVLEQTTSRMLTAPAFSPDGKRLCYLRIPLLTPEDLDRLDKFMIKRSELHERRDKSDSDEKWILPPASSEPEKPEERTGSWEDLTLPPMDDLYESLQQDHIYGQILMPVEIVVRDVATGDVISSLGFELPYAESKDTEINMIVTYTLTRPQYSADGQWVYFCLQNTVTAVNPSSGDKRMLAFPAAAALLSPDTKTAAVVQDKALGFIQTDGQRAFYIRREREDTPSASGLAWINNGTLVILKMPHSEQKKGKEIALDLVSSDGSLLREEILPLVGQGDEFDRGEIAVAPDGRHMAISFGPRVYFLETYGEVLNAWQHEKDLLVQPTFTADSTLVAFKYMKGDEQRAAAIVFFTPEGTEVSRVEIPKIEPGTIQPKPELSPEPESK